MTFEESYPRYPFSELVRLALAAGGLIQQARARHAARPDEHEAHAPQATRFAH